jgi:glycosyltransferase involved in cell wall biosynthesis
VRLLLATDSFPAYLNFNVEQHVAALADMGDDVCLLAKDAGDHPSPLRSGPWGRGRVEVVAPSGDGPISSATSLLRAAGNRHGLRILLRELRRGGRIDGRLLKVLYLLTPAASWRAELVHVTMLDVAVAWPELLAKAEVPSVVSCRGPDLDVRYLLGEPYRERIRTAFADADLVHCVSQNLGDRALALGLDPAKLFVCHWGVDTSFFSPAESHDHPNGSALRLVSAGRLHWEKGWDDVLGAVAQLGRIGLDVTYTIIGRGNTSERLGVLSAIRDLGLEDRVQVVGPWSRDEVRTALRSSDVFVLASRTEAISTAALEAMAVGLPVVITDAGGQREATDDGVEGLVVPPRDPNALAEAIGALARDPSLRATMGANGRRRVVREFDFLDRTRRLRDEYERLLETAGR